MLILWLLFLGFVFLPLTRALNGEPERNVDEFNEVISHFGTSAKNIVSSYNLNNASVRCKQFYQSYDEEEENIVKLVDSSTKIPSGIVVKSFYDLGDYDECMKIYGEFDNEEYRGKYCLTIHPTARTYLARCVPSVCSNDDVSNIFNESIIDSACYTYANKKSLSTGAYITISIISTFIFLAIISTSYELYLLQNNKACKHDILLAFSAIRSTKQIFKSEKDNQLACLNGLKAISMIHVVFHHTSILTLSFSPTSSVVKMGDIADSKLNIYMYQVAVVECFLFISGLLVAISFMRNYDKNGKQINVTDIFTSFVHRYIRLTPVFAMAILVYLYLMEYLNEGPLHYRVYDEFTKNCEKYWWSALTHIQNYYNPGTTCMAQSWYIAVDMQLYVLSPFYFIIIVKFTKFGKCFTGFLLIGAFLIPFCISYFYELPYTGHLYDNRHEDFMNYFYVPMHTRYGSYLLGILCGKFIHKIRKNHHEFKLNTGWCMMAWITTLAVISFACLGPALLINEPKNILLNSLFNGTYRIIFSASLASVILLCITGNGRFVNSFLSLPIFQVLAKLSYSMYIVHYAEIVIRITSISTIQKLTRNSIVFDFLGDFVITCVLSYFCVILFESPFMVIDKHLFRRSLGKKDKKKLKIPQ